MLIVMNVRNHIHLTGNLGADPKTITLPSGTMTTEFSLATNKYYRDAEGNRKSTTEWHRIKAYGKLASLFDQYLVKGSQISVVGAMQYRSWVDQFKQNRRSAEVIVDEFTFLDQGGKPRPEAFQTEPAHEMMVAEPSPAKTKKRRAKTAARPTKATANLGEVIESVEALED